MVPSDVLQHFIPVYENWCCSERRVRCSLIEAGEEKKTKTFTGLLAPLCQGFTHFSLLSLKFDRVKIWGQNLVLLTISRDLGHCLPKLSEPFSSGGRAGFRAGLRVWLITSPPDELKLSSPRLQSSILEESHWNVFGEESPSPRKPAVIFFFYYFFISGTEEMEIGSNVWETVQSEVPDENIVNLDISRP